MTRMRSAIWMASVALLAGSPSVWADGSVAAITRPNKDITLSFVRPGQVSRILVKEGRTVKVGQGLVQLDDAAEQAQLAQLKAQAEDTIRIKAARAQLDQKKADLKKTESAAEQGAAAALETEHAKLDVVIAELSLALARFEHTQSGRKYTEARIRVSRMRLISPIAGTVEQVHVEAGESVDALADVIRIVSIDPLWIDVPAPLEQARALKTGQVALIRFAGIADAVGAGTTDAQGKGGRTRPAGPERGAAPTANGKIIHIGSVADAASNTLTVRVEVPNPTGRPAGEHVRVSFMPLKKGAASLKAHEKAPSPKGDPRVGNSSKANGRYRIGRGSAVAIDGRKRQTIAP